jgi:O-antigen/teichoic acid export membrane protein
MTNKNSFFTQSVYTLFTKAYLLSFSIAFSIITARLVGVEGKGVLTLLQVIPAIVITIGELGIKQSIAFLTGQKKYCLNDIQTSMMSIYYISSVLCLLIAIIIYYFMSSFRYGISTIIFILLVPLLLFERYASGIFIGQKEIAKLNKVDIIRQSGLLIITLLLVAGFKKGVLGIAVAYFISQLSIVILMSYWIMKQGKIVPKWVKPIPQIIVKKGLIYALSLLVLMLNYRIDVLMLAKFTNEASVGIYSIGVNVCELLKQFPLAIGFVLFSHSTNWRQEDHKVHIEKISLMSRVMFLLTIFVSIVLAVASKWLVPLFYGDAFFQSYYVILWLLPGVIALSLFTILQFYSAGQGVPEIALYAFTPALVANVILNCWLIPRWSYLGAAFASTISYSIGTIVYLLIFCKKYNVAFRNLILINPIVDLKLVRKYIGK